MMGRGAQGRWALVETDVPPVAVLAHSKKPAPHRPIAHTTSAESIDRPRLT